MPRIGNHTKRQMIAMLRDRYGSDCHWCGKPMDFETLEERDSATIEHLRRKADGGTNEQGNLRLAHRHCNNHRHNARQRTPSGYRAPRRAHLPFHSPRHWL